MRVAWRECVAELIGTFTLCFISAGAICANAQSNGAVGLVGIAAASGLVLSFAIASTMAISGGQLNPAVTLALFATGRIKKFEEAGQLIVSQLMGAALAGFCLKAIYAQAAWRKARLGTPTLGPGVTQGTAIFLEALLSFFLVFAVYAMVVDPQGPKGGGFGIGMVYAFGILVGGPLTGASMNPARAFGPALAAWHWDRHIVYWIGPILGALVAAQVYDRFLRR